MTNPCSLVFASNGALTVTFNAVAQRPVIDLNGASVGIDNGASYTEGGSATTLASSALVTDADSANLASAQVRLTNILDGSAESLAVTGCAVGITVTPYNSGTGILALSGSSSLANYQACLRLVTYANTDQDPSSTSRTIEWTVNDGALINSPLAFTTLTVTPVNDAPVADDETVTATEDTALDTPVTTLLTGDSDVDSATLTVTAVSGSHGRHGHPDEQRHACQHGRRFRSLRPDRQPLRRRSRRL